MSKNSGYAKMKCKDEVIRYNNNRSPIYNSPSRASLTTVESEVDVVDDALTLQRFQVEICNSNCYNLLIGRVSKNIKLSEQSTNVSLHCHCLLPNQIGNMSN